MKMDLNVLRKKRKMAETMNVQTDYKHYQNMEQRHSEAVKKLEQCQKRYEETTVLLRQRDPKSTTFDPSKRSTAEIKAEQLKKAVSRKKAEIEKVKLKLEHDGGTL